MIEGSFLELSRCIWETLKIYYQHCHPGKKSIPGATIAIQTFGDFLGFNPHGHVLVTDGCFPNRAYLRLSRLLSSNIWKKSSDPKSLPCFSLKAKSLPIILIAEILEAFRVLGLLRSSDPSQEKRGHGKPCPLYHPGLLFLGTNDLSPGRVPDHLPLV